MRLEGKIAIVTGAGAGIGRATARRFAREGAAVVVADLSVARGGAVVAEIQAAGGRALFTPVDVAQTAQIDAVFDATLAEFGRVDVLVNNAYGASQARLDGDVLQVGTEVWDETMACTLRSVFYASQRAVREMLLSGGGSIVNISSVNGLFSFGLVAYSTAKGAIIAFTRAACLRYAGQGIRMNVICPGTIETDSTAPMLADPQVRRRLERLYARRRLGQPEEIAAAALYLAADESSFTNGTVMVVDGGLTVGRVDFALGDDQSSD